MGQGRSNIDIRDSVPVGGVPPETAEVSWYVIDSQGTILRAGKNHVMPNGAQTVGTSLFHLMNKDFHGIARKRIRALISSGEPQAFDCAYTDLNGSDFFFSVILIAEESDDQRAAARVLVRNETSRKEKEQALAQREDRYFQLSNVTLEGIAIHDDGIVVDCNEVLLMLTGYYRHEIIGEPIENVLLMTDGEDPLNTEDSDLWNIFEARLKTREDGNIPVEIHVRSVQFRGKKYRAVACRDISIRKKAEEELRKLHAVIDRSYSSIVITNQKGSIEYVNPAFTETTGYALREVVGKNPSILKTDLHDRKYYGELWRTILSGKVWEGEFLNRKKDGSKYWERAIISPVYNEKKEITHFLAIKDDITARKQASEALRRSEDKHRIVSDLISDYVYRFDLQGENDFSLNWTSGAFERITGYSETEINNLDNKWLSIIHPADKNKVLRQYVKNLVGESPLRTEYRIITKTGDVRWLSDYGQPIIESGDQVHAFLGAVQDITARKQVEEALRSSEANMNLLLKVIPDHIFVFNRKGILTNVFSNERDLNFKEAEEQIGKKYNEFFPKKLRKLFGQHLEKAFKSGDLQTFEYDFEQPNGSRVFEARLIITGSDQIIAVLRDITEKKNADSALRRAMEDAERANRSKSAFLANMSHEIRTPINAVLGFADLLYEQVQEPLQRNYLRSIISSGTTLMTLLNDILDLSKIEAGKMSINAAKVDVAAILEEIRHIFSLKSSEKGIEYAIQLEELDPCLYEVDELRLRQILLNLVDNAIKFTDQGMVRIVARSSELKSVANHHRAKLEIRVEDSGVGIPVEYQGKIFKSFVQQEEQDKRKHGGTGLGLAITKRLVKLMGGEITLKSEPGQGSVFAVVFPSVPIHRLPSMVLQSDSKDPSLSLRIARKTILIVGKDSIRRREVRSIFRGEDNNFIEVDGVESVGTRDVPSRPDLAVVILNDIPEEILSARDQLRSQSMLKEMPIVMVQPYDERDVDRWRPEDPLCLFVQHPVKAETLIQRVRGYLEPVHDAEAPLQKQSAELRENQALIQQLEAELMPRWEATAYSASFREIEMFAEDIGEIADRYDNHNLKKFSKQLMVHAHHFDIDNMHALLGGFPKLVEQLKKRKPA